MNGLNETIKTKKMPENGETEAVINTEGAVNAEAAATNRMLVRECVKERGRFSRVFETKGGEKAAVIYPKAVHFQENGVWKSIDNTLALSKDQLSYENIKSKKYLSRKYPAVPLGRFADLPFIMLTQGNDTRTRGDRLCRNVGFKPNIVLEFNQQSTAYMASSTQLGATFISDILVSQLPTFENLVYYKLDGEEAKRKVFFYYKTHKYKTRVMEEFVRMMHEQI